MEEWDEQNVWNFLLSIVFALLLGGSMWVLYQQGSIPTSIPFFDVLLIVLATFRLIRLFGKDTVTAFIRDWFAERNEIVLDTGLVTVEYLHPPRGPRRAMSELLGCPWCMGVWCALFVTFFYFLTPLSWYVILILAVAGVATFIQLVANAVGWSAERGKREAEKLS